MSSVARRYAGQPSPFDRPSNRPDGSLLAPVVLMVSGGVDSTALTVLAATGELDIADGRGVARIARERLHVLHVNHLLRGEAADRDEEAVRALAARFGIPCTVRRVDVAALARTTGDGNVENAGRLARYAAATDLANALSATVGTARADARILTAHTADDRAETFLMNAVRGTGAAGLSSIPRHRNRVVRPLLDRTHEELRALLAERGIGWCEDATNADTRYLRAFVRHEVVPVLEARNPRLVQTLATTCEILSDEDSYLTSVAARTLRGLTRRRQDGMVALDAVRLSACEVAIARRVVRAALLQASPEARLEARHVEKVLRLVAAGQGSASLASAIDARVEFGLLIVRAAGTAPAIAACVLEVPGTLALPGGRTLAARLLPAPDVPDPAALARAHGREWLGQSVLLDAMACGVDPTLGGRLWVDAPQPGDVMCPLGMHGQSKKVSDLLGEARVPVADRPLVPVVRASATGPVVWVAGIRADERSRVTPTTRGLVELTLSEA